MKRKSGLAKFNSFLCVVLVIAVLATIYVVSKPVKVDTGEVAEVEDVAVIDEFKAGTYGGVEFGSIEDVVTYYNQCYDYTKTLMADYTENGAACQKYKLVGEEELIVNNILIEGKANSMIENLVPGVVGGLFSGGVNGLSPSGGATPEIDTRNDGTFDCKTSALTADDILAANVTENEDGTIKITFQPKAVLLSMPGQDSQGRVFNSLGDISGVVADISILSFSQGTIDENFVVNYIGGTAEANIDPATGEVVSGNYVMKVHIDVKHACVAVLKDKNASLDITYTSVFPASDEYLAERGISRA